MNAADKLPRLIQEKGAVAATAQELARYVADRCIVPNFEQLAVLPDDSRLLRTSTLGMTRDRDQCDGGQNM